MVTCRTLTAPGRSIARTEGTNKRSWATLVGKPRVPGTRISIEFLLECLACGMTIPEIVEEYPTLTEAAIKGTLEELAHSDRIAAP